MGKASTGTEMVTNTKETGAMELCKEMESTSLLQRKISMTANGFRARCMEKASICTAMAKSMMATGSKESQRAKPLITGLLTETTTSATS